LVLWVRTRPSGLIAWVFLVEHIGLLVVLLLYVTESA
jgi:hypothetical protein